MLFPFRSSAIFRNRWIALLWAVGICFMASEIVDSLSGVTNRDAGRPAVAHATPTPAQDDAARVAAVLQGPPPEPDHIAR